MSSVAFSSVELPPRTTSMVTVSPGEWESIATVSSSELPIGSPSTAITMSCSRMPASAPALPGSTFCTKAPSRVPSVTDRVEIPSVACTADPVVAIGSPLGLAGTVTTGIVSALERPVRLAGEGSDTKAVISAVQTDAPINPGNSGGALVDASGAVIGINTAIASVGGGSVGLGFAIPINTARDIAEQLISTGEAVHASLGVNARSVTDGTRDGALVLNVEPGSPASDAGIREEDVVIAVEGDRVGSSEELAVAVDAHHPGDKVTVEVVRGGRSQTFEATLAAA